MVVQYVSILTYVHTLPCVFFTRAIGRALSHIPLVIYELVCVFWVCAQYQCQLCSSAEGLWRFGGEWVVVVEEGEGATLDARLVFTLAGPKALPLSVTQTDQGLIALHLSPQLGVEHTTVAEQGSSSHPTN